MAGRPSQMVGLAAFLSTTVLAEIMKAYQYIMAKRFEEHQIEALKLAFEGSEHLTKAKKIELVEATGLDMEQIASWFNRKRSCKRAKEAVAQLELDHSRLREALKLSRANKAILQQELEESNKRAAELQDENRCLKQSLTIAERDEQFGNLDEVCEWELRDELLVETEIVAKDSMIGQEWGEGSFEA